MTLILPLAVALVAWCFPAKIQVVLLVVNMFLPDSLPVVDEVIQVVGIVKSLSDG